MSKAAHGSRFHPADRLFLTIQDLYKAGKISDEMPLLKIDYRERAEQAPFQFDIVNARLHRTTCIEIKSKAGAPLYAVWKPTKEDIRLACDTCRPAAVRGEAVERDNALDIVFGFLSLIDQFSSVLKERGREYRASRRGKAFSEALNALSEEPNGKRRNGKSGVIPVMEALQEILQGCNESLLARGNGAIAGKPKSNGAAGPRRREKKGAPKVSKSGKK